MSKVDCTNIINFFNEKKRLTENCSIACGNCPISQLRYDETGEDTGSCNYLIAKYPNKAVEIIQKWSDENPQKTRLDDFTEKYPNYFREPKDDTPNVCCKYLGYIAKCPLTKCSECWNMSL